MQEEEIPQLEQEAIVEIDAIRQWFEKGELNSLRENLENQMRFKVAPNVETLKKEIEWDKYLVHNTKSGRKAYEFSLKYDKSLVPKSVLEGQEEWSGERLFISERVLFFPEGEDDYRIGIFKFYASGNNVNLNEQDFLQQFNVKHQSSESSGLIEEYSWEEEFIKGYRVNDGEITHIRSKISETERELLSRANTYTCSGYLVEYCMMYLTIVTTQDGVSYSFSNGDQECFQSIEVMECAMQQNESPWPEDDPLPGDGPGGGDGPPKSDCTNCCFDPITELVVECEQELDDEIIKHPSFVGTTADCIYEKLKSIDGFKDLASGFEGLGTEFDVVLKIGATQNSSANGQAWWRGSNQPIEITFNEDRMNRSALEVARTIVHEMVHAELYRAINTTNPTEKELDFRETFNTYVMMYRGSADQQHNLMADEWVTKMGEILKDVHQMLDPDGYNTFKDTFYPNGIPDHFYKSVAWEGLTDTIAWDLMKNVTTTPPVKSPYEIIKQDIENVRQGRKICL